MEFDRSLRALCDHEVNFVVIGGLSAALHGSAHVTYDLAICYSRGEVNLKRLATALAPFHPRPLGFPAELPFVWDEATLRNSTVLTLTTDVGEIDLLAEVAGIGDWEKVRNEAILDEVFDRNFFILDLKSLIQAKRAAGRPKDLAVLPELESLLEAGEP
ncbi:MAG TPA: hypothetical protein VG297_16985 [Bryobacteraceae bacterium]|jgi:hypothetical protein|nr:hypothetical protein [Bryobacteraceae bacterium]